MNLHHLDELLSQLHREHAAFYYSWLLLSAFGIFGVLCLLGVFS